MADLTEREIIAGLHGAVDGLLKGIALAGRSMRVMMFGVYLLAVSNIILVAAIVWLLAVR